MQILQGGRGGRTPALCEMLRVRGEVGQFFFSQGNDHMHVNKIQIYICLNNSYVDVVKKTVLSKQTKNIDVMYFVIVPHAHNSRWEIMQRSY